MKPKCAAVSCRQFGARRSTAATQKAPPPHADDCSRKTVAMQIPNIDINEAFAHSLPNTPYSKPEPEATTSQNPFAANYYSTTTTTTGAELVSTT